MTDARALIAQSLSYRDGRGLLAAHLALAHRIQDALAREGYDLNRADAGVRPASDVLAEALATGRRRHPDGRQASPADVADRLLTALRDAGYPLAPLPSGS